MDEEAFSGCWSLREGFSARDEGSAFGFAGLDEAEDSFVLGFCDLGALEGGCCEGVAYYGDLLDLGFEGCDEGVVDGFLDKDSGGCGADLALVGHYS